MKISGLIRLSPYGMFAIQADLKGTGKIVREIEQRPDEIVIELESDKPYTLDGIPIKFKIKAAKKPKNQAI